MKRLQFHIFAGLGLLMTGQAFCANEAFDVRSEFLQRLRLVADSGKLGDPASVAQLLNLKFEISMAHKTSKTADCSDNLGKKSFDEKKIEATGDSWYYTTPPVAPPGQTTLIPPALTYESDHWLSCPDRTEYRLPENTVTRLDFRHLEGLTCITSDDILKHLPGVEYVTVFDGPGYYQYRGKQDDTAGTIMTLSFSSDCVGSVGLEQNQEYGSRYKRAEYKYLACTEQAIHDYCAKHPNTDWDDAGLRQYQVKQCGTLIAFYRTEPMSGAAPPPLPRQKAWSERCHGT